MSEFAACTIVANNYLAYARVFARSLREFHPTVRVFALIVDRPHHDIDYANEPFTAVFAEELDVAGFANMAFRYTILELSTALKPYFLQHLNRHQGVERALYFDPDILVLGDLSSLADRLEQHDLVLTPHITAPLDDDHTPSELDFLLSGIYNLGFVGVALGERTAAFLDWWSRRLHKLCLHEVWRGLFVDQRWMDFAPAFVSSVAIVRDPGYNVAYWNLAHRALRRDAMGWRVNDAPLSFFHFSGFAIEEPSQISKFQNRFALAERPDLLPLFHDYSARLRAADHLALKRLPYAFGKFSDGTTVPLVARRALRGTDGEGVRWADPFSADGPDTFLDWLRQRPTPQAYLPRICMALWDQRADLQGAFPAPHGADAARYLDWLRGASGKAELEASWLKNAAQPHDTAATTGIPHPTQHRGAETNGGDLPVLALELHRARFDLQMAFPEPLGSSLIPYAEWFCTYGRLEYDLTASQIRPALRHLSPFRRLRSHLWHARHAFTRSRNNRRQTLMSDRATPTHGDPEQVEPGAHRPAAHGVNVVGWSSAPTGVGEVCRGSLAALRALKVPHALKDLARGDADWASSVANASPSGMPFDVSLYHVNADMVGEVARLLPSTLQAGRYRIGYWFWELAHFPLHFADSFERLDEIWAPSRFCEEAFLGISPIPVRRVPPCVPAPAEAATQRSELGVPENAFLFYNAFDALSVPERKNPWAVLAALRLLVQEARTPVHLMLKVHGIRGNPEVLDRLRAECSGLPVTLLTETLSRASVNGLTAAADAFVSLHRSEGLGLHLIEAMYLEKPVVATNYGGSTDFLDSSTGWPIPYRLQQLRQQYGPYPAGAVWADPDIAAAAQAMRTIVAQGDEVKARAQAARARVRSLYSLEVAAPRLRNLLEGVWTQRCGPQAADGSLLSPGGPQRS